MADESNRLDHCKTLAKVPNLWCVSSVDTEKKAQLLDKHRGEKSVRSGKVDLVAQRYDRLVVRYYRNPVVPFVSWQYVNSRETPFQFYLQTLGTVVPSLFKQYYRSPVIPKIRAVHFF